MSRLLITQCHNFALCRHLHFFVQVVCPLLRPFNLTFVYILALFPKENLMNIPFYFRRVYWLVIELGLWKRELPCRGFRKMYQLCQFWITSDQTACRFTWRCPCVWYDMIWYDMICYDMIWFDIWYDVMWCDTIWYDMIWFDIWYDVMSCHVMWYDTIWYDMLWYDMIWFDIWYDVMWCDVIWYDTIWYNMIRCAVIWHVFVNCN
jgi:hypothetical protein